MLWAGLLVRRAIAKIGSIGCGGSWVAAAHSAVWLGRVLRAGVIGRSEKAQRGVAGGLAGGVIMKIGSIGGGGAGWRRRTPRSGWEVGVVRAAPARRSGGVLRRARR